MEQISPFSTRVVATAARTSAPDADLSDQGAGAPRLRGSRTFRRVVLEPGVEHYRDALLARGRVGGRADRVEVPVGAGHPRLARLRGDGEPPALDGAVSRSGLVGAFRGERPGTSVQV